MRGTRQTLLDDQRRNGRAFHGWRVVGAAFVLAVFGWGMGFYGPPVFLRVIGEERGWPLALVSTAVTVHFLVGALAGASLPATPSALRHPGRDQGWRARAGCRRPGLGGGIGALAALRRDIAQRRGLGCDERGGTQCDRLALVRAHATRRTRDGVQRRQHRRRHFLAVVGGRDRAAGISGRSGNDRRRRGGHDVGARRPGVFPDAAADGIVARRRSHPARPRRRSPRRRRGHCPARCCGAISRS